MAKEIIYNLADTVQMKKPHACQTNDWEILRMGADLSLIHIWPIITLPERDAFLPIKIEVQDERPTTVVFIKSVSYTHLVFEEDGINEYHVAMSATESAYANDRVMAVDPFNTEKGILEEAMVTVVLPYIKTAKEGVIRLGKIVEKHGAAEADGILFADRDEAWYMEIGSGHHWVAQRIPDDSYAVVANQLAIQEIDFDSDNFL